MAQPIHSPNQAAAGNLRQMIQIVSGATVSKTLIDAFGAKQILFAMDAEQELSEHTSPMLAIVQVAQGTLTCRVQGQSYDLSEAGWLLFPPNAPHAVRATSASIWLLTMIKAS